MTPDELYEVATPNQRLRLRAIADAYATVKQEIAQREHELAPQFPQSALGSQQFNPAFAGEAAGPDGIQPRAPGPIAMRRVRIAAPPRVVARQRAPGEDFRGSRM